jgi:hypothetical protein
VSHTGYFPFSRVAQDSRHHKTFITAAADLVYNRERFSPGWLHGATMRMLPGETWLIGGVSNEVISWSE